MNPPSVIQSAMSRDRKPFTYTPGGLDLSEIKSQRMAQRLMRNAMNQGVPEVSVQSMQSPPMPSTPVIVPNFNCLPVQVFPTFNLPANPKSLLRTRSNPDNPREPPGKRITQTSIENSNGVTINNKEPYNSNATMNSQICNNRPISMYEYSSIQGNNFATPLSSYSDTGHYQPTLPEISYDAEYLLMPSITDHVTNTKSIGTNKNSDISVNINNVACAPVSDTNLDNLSSKTKPVEEETGNITQREVTVNKSIKTEQTTTKVQNGNQNGDIEAEMSVTLPTKKAGATIETKVEVEKKLLPDGQVEEVTTTTTTKTTTDGKTEKSSKSESRILPDDEVEEEIEEIEEEEEEEEEVGSKDVVLQKDEDKTRTICSPESEANVNKSTIIATINDNSQDKNIIKTEIKSETTVTTTKKVAVVQSDNEETEEVEEEVEEEEQVEEEEIEEVEPVTTVSIKKLEKDSTPPPDVTEYELGTDKAELRGDESSNITNKVLSDALNDNEEEEVILESKQDIEKQMQTIDESVNKEQNKPETQEVEVFEEAEATPIEKEIEIKIEKETVPLVGKNNESEEQTSEQNISENKTTVEAFNANEKHSNENKIDQGVETKKEENKKDHNEKIEQILQIETRSPLREPSIPLDKIEDIEIKPIGPAGVITKTHTEKTEIITSSSDQPAGVHSTQTEYNRIENIVTVNRTTIPLDNNTENLAHHEIPTVKTYFSPGRVLSSPMPTSPYQPVYPPVTTERRHSLLLDRLSVDRQMPSEIYHNQTYEQQRQTSQEPQSEVLTISNVKPSKITNQQWYQQSKDSVNSNVTLTPMPSDTQSWAQPKVQSQPTYNPQPTYQPPQSYQPQQPLQTQQSYQPQPTYQPQQTYQTQQSYPPQPAYQPPQSYAPQPQYQPSYTDSVETNKYSTYTPKPVNRVSSLDIAPTNTTSSDLYSFNNNTSDSYQNSTQQYSSSYVPPPWEQDSLYIADLNQNYYKPPPADTFNPTPIPSQSWKSTVPKGKFSKPPPTAYIPPAPNQSFVIPVSNVESSKQSGRKTYYSEYERRYISVPESTYIPQETKFQPQPDPSPKYYYDNTESNENVEHQWRKELREFTEKTSQTQTHTDLAAVKPPWESDTKYTKTTEQTYTSTPTWSQTVRPRSWRERSFESEYVGSQEWPKTNSLGRGRPLSSYNNKNESIPERTRGVSVDRYNPISYKPPTTMEHPPVQSHTLPTPAPHATYHNPNVPTYHSRASDEIREQPSSYRQPPRVIREQRASPFQSRSFKYLQWITGTED